MNGDAAALLGLQLYFNLLDAGNWTFVARVTALAGHVFRRHVFWSLQIF